MLNSVPVFTMIASIPVDSFIINVGVEVTVGFNAATTNVLSLGVTQATATELIPSASITAGTPGFYAPASIAAVYGRQKTQTAQPILNNIDVAQGGVGIWAKFTQTGSPATLGTAIFTLTYVGPGDNS